MLRFKVKPYSPVKFNFTILITNNSVTQGLFVIDDVIPGHNGK